MITCTITGKFNFNVKIGDKVRKVYPFSGVRPESPVYEVLRVNKKSVILDKGLKVVLSDWIGTMNIFEKYESL